MSFVRILFYLLGCLSCVWCLIGVKPMFMILRSQFYYFLSILVPYYTHVYGYFNWQNQVRPTGIGLDNNYNNNNNQYGGSGRGGQPEVVGGYSDSRFQLNMSNDQREWKQFQPQGFQNFGAGENALNIYFITRLSFTLNDLMKTFCNSGAPNRSTSGGPVPMNILSRYVTISVYLFAVFHFILSILHHSI